MEGNRDKAIEVQLKKAARRALKQLLQSIEREPRTLVIESDDTQADTSEEASAEIRAFLFKRR